MTRRYQSRPLLDLTPGAVVCKLPKGAGKVGRSSYAKSHPTEDQPTYVDYLPEVTRDRED